jgi:hypothetical protein
MGALPNDTHPAAQKVQFDLLRRAPIGRRAAIARSLSATTIELSRRALRGRMPSATEADVIDRWLSLSYGSDLARRVRRYLDSRS